MPAKSNPAYDLPTAVTFFLAGLGVGAVLALVFSLNIDPAIAERRQGVRHREYSPAL